MYKVVMMVEVEDLVKAQEGFRTGHGRPFLVTHCLSACLVCYSPAARQSSWCTSSEKKGDEIRVRDIIVDDLGGRRARSPVVLEFPGQPVAA